MTGMERDSNRQPFQLLDDLLYKTQVMTQINPHRHTCDDLYFLHFSRFKASNALLPACLQSPPGTALYDPDI